MVFEDEIEILGEMYFSFRKLALSKHVDIEKLKNLAQDGVLFGYLPNSSHKNGGIYAFGTACDLSKKDKFHYIEMNYFKTEDTKTGIAWSKFYFKKSEIEKSGIIPLSNDNRKTAEEFVAAISEEVQKIFNVSRYKKDEKAVHAALSCLAKSSFKFIEPIDISIDIFSKKERPDRAYRAKLVNAVLKRNGYPQMTQVEIIKILSK